MILLIDSYDSFSNNLKTLLEDVCGDEVQVIQNDSIAREDFPNIYQNWFDRYDFIVIGPGPGHPTSDNDTGVIKWLLQHYKTTSSAVIPILGVCLGFQCICTEFGNEVTALDDVRHGQIFEINCQESELFDAKSFRSVRYHSLGVELKDINDSIIPLAYCEDNSKRILMAGKHKSLPLYGVQYHPESICSERGNDLIQKFKEILSKYNEKYERSPSYFSSKSGSSHQDNNMEEKRPKKSFEKVIRVEPLKISNLHVDALDMADFVRSDGKDILLLNSAASPGSWSFIGLPIKHHSHVVTHSMKTPNLIKESMYGCTAVKQTYSSSIWSYTEDFMKDKIIDRNILETLFIEFGNVPPFIGGLLGFFSYEEGRYVDSSLSSDDTYPDTKLIFIERVIIYHRPSKKWLLVSIKDQDDEWLQNFKTYLESSLIPKLSKENTPTSLLRLTGLTSIQKILPEKEIYERQFEECQRLLRSGDLYELCLTTQLVIKTPVCINAWDMFKILAIHKNPSPFSSFLEFDDSILVSSSPERFLSWSRHPTDDRTAILEYRPIKGTVRKNEFMTESKAKTLLRTPKEMGENLMIVDLIRHDLSEFSRDVEVDSLMAIEEYETVFQLVSVIKGSIDMSQTSVLDVLASSLPPGSMTGAPKKRSVELLQSIESLQPSMSSRRRGLYSGVAGYWSITDEADWSVTIRSLFHYKADLENTSSHNVWRIGAGGAITVMSEFEAEWEEMMVKLESTLRIFS